MTGCGSTILPAVYKVEVDRQGNPANPWRAWIPALPGAYVLAKTKREALALQGAPDWADRVAHEAFRQDQLCEAPHPMPRQAHIWGTWDPCVSQPLPDAQALLIAATGPGCGRMRGRDTWLWWCSADDLAHPPPDLPPIVHAPRE